MIKIKDKSISNIFFGKKEIIRVFVGKVKVYEKEIPFHDYGIVFNSSKKFNSMKKYNMNPLKKIVKNKTKYNNKNKYNSKLNYNTKE